MKQRITKWYVSIIIFSLGIFLAVPPTTSYAADFVPRTTAPTTNNAYYYSLNPFYRSGYGMPNCTAYAYGRAYELLGTQPKLSTGNAGQWWWYNISSKAYSYGSTPKLGAIACWDNYDKNQGHVAVVEKINGNNVTISESHYKSTFFDTRTITSNSSNYLTSKRFLGYIYLNDFENQHIPTVPTGTQTISNGKYHIVSALNPNQTLDVASASKADKANIQLYNSLTTPQQVFEITYLGDGYYKIVNTNSNKCLDVEGAGTQNGTNVQQFTYNNEDRQKWVIQVSEDGYYYNIVSKHSGLYLDVYNGSSENGANVQVWEKNNSAAQKWKFIAWGKDNGQTISDGDYHISTVADINQTLDVYAGLTENKANIQIYNSLNNPLQVFHVTYLGDGYYKIYNTNSGKCLDIPGDTGTSGSNVQQYDWNGGNGQQWIIKEAGNDCYYIISKWNGMYLDADEGQNKDGTNVQVWVGNQSAAQKWKFVAWGNNVGQTVEDGDYYIATSLDTNQTLDVYAGSTENEANIQLYSSLNNPIQIFHVTYLNNGYYKIYNLNSGKCIEIPGGTGTSGSNVQQYDSNDGNGQQWIIKDTGDGFYHIISKCNGMYLDAEAGESKNGTNVRVWVANSSAAQKWKFIPADTTKPVIDCAKFSIIGCSAAVGEKAEVYVELQNNPGIVGATIGVKYDASKLKLISSEDLGILNDYQFSTLTQNPFLMNWEDPLATENNKSNGKIVKLCFEVLKDPGDDGIDLQLSVDTIYDVDIKDVSYTTIDGKITQKAYKPGDVNEDGVVNSKDSILLRKYILGSEVTINKTAADVNKDGAINSKDSILLRKYILGSKVELK